MESDQSSEVSYRVLDAVPGGYIDPDDWWAAVRYLCSHDLFEVTTTIRSTAALNVVWELRSDQRAAAALNPALPEELQLEALRGDNRHNVLLNPALSPVAQLEVIGAGRCDELRILARNPALNSTSVAALVATGDPETLTELARNNSVDIDDLHDAYSIVDVDYYIAQRTQPPARWAEHLVAAGRIEVAAGIVSYLERDAFDAVLARLTNPAAHPWLTRSRWCPPELLEGFARSGYADIRLLVARNPATPAVTLTELAGSSDRRIRAAVAANPAAPPSALAELVADREPAVRRAAAVNPQLDDAGVAALAADTDVGVRQLIAARPALTESVVRRLLNDESLTVRETVVRVHYNDVSVDELEVTLLVAAPEPPHSERLERSQVQAMLDTLSGSCDVAFGLLSQVGARN